MTEKTLPSPHSPIEGRAVRTQPPTLEPARDLGRYARLGLVVLLLGFGGFFLWAALAPLDSGVPAPGTAVVASQRKTIAHLRGGIVKAIHVVEAQHVKAGDPLVTLDDTQIGADYRATLKTYYALLAQKSRLEAEQRDAETVTFPRELIEAGGEGDADTQRALQAALFHARRRALRGEIELLRAQLETYRAQARSAEAQLAFLQQQLAGMRALAREGYAPRNRQLELERQALELRNRMEVARRQAEETELRIRQTRKDYRKEVETQLAEVVQNLATTEERLEALKDELAHTVIRAPVSGFVNDLKVHTVGGVVRPGEPLMEIIPENERLLFDVRIPPHMIDRIHPGQAADIQIGAFVSRPQLILKGEVVSVSADIIVPGNPNQPPYYLARVKVTPEGLRELGDLRLQPGMPATVIIKTGEQTLMQYLLKPLKKRLHTALTEE